MDKKSAAMWQYRWKDEVIAAGLLLPLDSSSMPGFR